MRILYQCNGFLLSTIGGAEVMSYHLTKELTRRGHQLLIVAPRKDSDPPGYQTFDGLDLVRLDFGPAIESRSPAALRDINRSLTELVRNFGPDVLHLNDAWIAGLFFIRGAATGDLPRVLTLHSVIRAAGRDGLQARLVADADRVVAVSHAQGNAAQATMPALESKLSIIPNALPLPDFTPTEWSFSQPMMLCVGRLRPEKGFDVAIRAMAGLRGKGIAARLVIAGDGTEKNPLQSLAIELGVSEQVEFCGWITPDAVSSLIGTATIVLVPSRWAEPFGLVALQAAQMGRPTIASRIGGLPEIVEHGETGILVAPDNADALCEAIQFLLSDPHNARRMGSNALDLARTKFDFQVLVDRYEDVLTQAQHAARYRRFEGIPHA